MYEPEQGTSVTVTVLTAISRSDDLAAGTSSVITDFSLKKFSFNGNQSATKIEGGILTLPALHLEQNMSVTAKEPYHGVASQAVSQ